MFSYYRTRGFIFKREDRLEADRVFSVFTEDFGRIEIWGRAVRKITSKLRGGIELFSVSEIVFVQGKNKRTLTDAVAQNKFRNLAESPEKLLTALKISRIIDRFINGQEQDKKIFELIIETFEKLNENTFSPLVYHYFFWNFISILGYGPQISLCAVCQKALNPDNLYFLNEEGGIICQNCAVLKKEKIKISSDCVKIIRLVLSGNLNILFKLKMEYDISRQMGEISDGYCNYLTQKL